MKIFQVQIVLLLLISINLNAQSLWNPIEQNRIPAEGTRYIQPTQSRTYTLDETEVLKALETVSLENTDEAFSRPSFFEMPLPDGTMTRFKIVNSPVMAKELGDRYPEIKTYSGIDINNPLNTVRFDVTPQGFHAMLFTEDFGTVYIDPYSFGQKGHYVVYERKNFRSSTDKTFECGVVGTPVDISQTRLATTPYGDCSLRTYRTAIAATAEYTAFHGGTKALALAAQVTTMNRVNMVYMRDMAIFMELVPNNDLVVYTNANTDPYSSGNAGELINQVTVDLNNKIGSANYDVGHVFDTEGGGLAGLGVICSAFKAEGVTGITNPIGDPFDIDFVSHEFGHQFGCNHTQNNNCQRNSTTAFEPGSASTIMGYAGICTPNVQNNSDDHFHAISLQEMSNQILNTSCPTITPLSNTAPVINSVTTGHTIPAGTAFALTADVTDSDGDPVSYCWEQMDRQVSTQPPVSTSTGGPNFRSNPPTSDPTRYFPNLADYIAGNSPTWEVLATVTRDFNFRVSVRDNASGGGCSVYDDVDISVDGNSGPFLVLNPTNTGVIWNIGANETVTWDVAGTDSSPVNCANVDILLSTDGGFTYPTTLASNVLNNGGAVVTVPNSPTSTARIKIVCSDNVFYDISDNDFTIMTGSPDFTLSIDPLSIDACGINNETFTVSVSSLQGYSDLVNLSVSGLPAGVSASFNPTSLAPLNNASSTLILSGSPAAGSYTFNVEGSSTSGIKTLNVNLNIDAALSAQTLQFPANGATNLSGNISFDWADESGANVSYDIEISDDIAFSNIVFASTNLSDSEFDQGNFNVNTTYYWRVRATNSCGPSPFSPISSFTTANCQITASTDVPVDIPSNLVSTVTSSLTYSGMGPILDLNVLNLIGNHTWINDLTISLTSPAGTTVILFGTICDDENNFNLSFDDDAANSNYPCPPNDGGIYQPQESLATFNGEDPNGTWTLSISDSFDQDGGALTNWELEICEAESVVQCLADIVISDTHSTGIIIDEASNSISSTEVLTGTAVVDYSSGNEINLTAGFTVDMGATLHAYILGCTP